MENKYYEADVQDINIGDIVYTKLRSGELIQCNINEGYEIDELGYWFYKFLDRADIEELGWDYEGKTTELWFKIPDVDMQPFNLIYRSFMLSYNLADYRCQIVGYEWTDCRSMNNNEGEVLFLGAIKNYNKLKTVMKWVGIKK